MVANPEPAFAEIRDIGGFASVLWVTGCRLPGTALMRKDIQFVGVRLRVYAGYANSSLNTAGKKFDHGLGAFQTRLAAR